MIISFASSKGGVGKSTTAAAVAAGLALAGERVQVIDLDQAQALSRWSRRVTIPGLAIAAVAREDFPAYFRDLQAGDPPDHVLIDLPGVRETTVLKAIARSDLVVIPSQASELDLYEALRVVSDIRAVAAETGRAVPYRLLLTKVFPLRTRVVDYAYAEMARHGLPLFRTALVERSVYKEQFLTGRPPSLAEPDKGAGREIADLIAEMQAVAAGEEGRGAAGWQAEHAA
ncbi:MAG TPA: ParA family protein [Hyphomicrobiaceae bacterium]|nr:ParA family protein [Hyphomicrobiaceae bacterium]